jgi:alkaline phosphatase D
MKSLFTKLFLFACLSLFAQNELLKNGPMLGYSEMREVMIWLQTSAPATVFIEYQAKEGGKKFRTATYATQSSEAYTAHLICDSVLPGNRYTYTVFINNKAVKAENPQEFQTQTLWQWRSDPPEFSFAIGSCNYVNEDPYDRPGKPFGGDYSIFNTIHAKRPDFMVWMGDNTYLREVDWFTETGIRHRYTHSRNIPELKALLASTHHYATWDDHDYGPNDSDRSFRSKKIAEKAFQDFWANPSYGLTQGGVSTYFQWADCEFIVLDNRYFRTPNYRKDGPRTLLGEEQKEWLKDILVSSRATFKFVVIGGQVLNPSPVFETYYNIAPEERQEILDYIELHKVKNVIFLTGDRHHTILNKIENANGHAVYDLTCSSLTAGSAKPHEEKDDFSLAVESTLVIENNYALLILSGELRKRKLKIEVFNTAGELKWELSIDQQ